jgi:hypothetical protein
MRLAAVLVALLALGIGDAGVCAPAPQPRPAIRHACTIDGCDHCPRGRWKCDGKCIPKNQACRVFR